MKINWNKRPEDCTHVNPLNMRSYKVTPSPDGDMVQVWIKNSWSNTAIPANRLTAKPTNLTNSTEEETEMKNTTTLTFSSVEEIKQFLATDTSTPEEVKEALVDFIKEQEEEECNCDDCTSEELSKVITELEEIQKKADALKKLVDAGKVSAQDGILKAIEYATKAMELHAKGADLAAKLEANTEEEEKDNTEYLSEVVNHTLDFLKEKGVEPTGDAYKGMVSATAMTIAALDDLGYIVKK